MKRIMGFALLLFVLLPVLIYAQQIDGKIAIVLLGGERNYDLDYLRYSATDVLQMVYQSTWGQLDLTYELLGPFPESLTCSPLCLACGDLILRDHGIDPDQYFRLEYINPYNSSCPCGVAEWGGKHIFLNGGAALNAHELGHTLSVTASANVFDPMGAYERPTPLFTVLNKARIEKFLATGGLMPHPDWVPLIDNINPAWMINTGVGGTVTLGPLEYDSGLPASARLPLSDGRYLYFEYRAALGNDSNLIPGVYVTEGPGIAFDCDPWNVSCGSTFLGMATAASPDYADCANGILITLLDADSQQATFATSNHTCPPSPPPPPRGKGKRK